MLATLSAHVHMHFAVLSWHSMSGNHVAGSPIAGCVPHTAGLQQQYMQQSSGFAHEFDNMPTIGIPCFGTVAPSRCIAVLSASPNIA